MPTDPLLGMPDVDWEKVAEALEGVDAAACGDDLGLKEKR